MLHQVIITSILIIPLFITTKCNHTSKTENDVIVTYSNHAEAEPKPEPKPEPKKIKTETEINIVIPEKLIKENKKNYDEMNQERDSNEVVFVPNEREVERNEDYLVHNPVRVEDYMARRTVDDAMDNGQVRVETEPPADIVFLSGKNNENQNTEERKKEMFGDTRRSGTEIDKVVKLNCTNLDCNNTVDSVCGGKVEHKQWRYRLFMNECFFRKVNCYFKHSTNRYHPVSLDKCRNVGAHVATRPSLSQLYPPAPVHKVTAVKVEPVKLHSTRRSFSARRSLTMSMDGHSCSHTCPATCPDDYQPQCAVSGAGLRRVFENHCKLDYNSCALGIVWRARPLAECVGGKRADMRQNRGFIAWMQRVGIVDNKGRLVLS